MGAQVIFAVNHAYLDRLDESCLNWLGLQASVHADNPRTWLASEWDKHDRSNGRSRSAPDIRPALSFSYSDYQATNTILVAHDMILQMYGLYDLSFQEATEFPDLAKQIARKARYHQSPFHDRSFKHSFSKSAPAPVQPGQGSITVFVYETDAWGWRNDQESRAKLADVARYCATGKPGKAFPYDPQSGEYLSSFRPLCTLGPEQRAIIRQYEAKLDVLVLPQRPMSFSDLTKEVGCSDDDVIKALMASEGYGYERDLSLKPPDHGL